MQSDAFRAFLKARYPELKSDGTRATVLSRCNRVERELDVNLDDFDAISLSSLHDDARKLSKSRAAGNDLVSALKRYGEFLAAS